MRAGLNMIAVKTLQTLVGAVVTDSSTTGANVTLPSGDIAATTVRLTNGSLTSIAGITVDTVYGVRKGDIEFIKTQKNWINYEDFLTEKLAKLKEEDLVGLEIGRAHV